MANLGDIDVQSLAGATSTGTHGTGARFGGIATQIRGIEIVLADGSVVSASADENVELFEAGRLGLGAIGIISKITLACVPRFTLRAIEEPDTLSHILDTLEGDRLGLDHFEFYWFPHTDRVLTKSNTRLPGDTEPDPVGKVRASSTTNSSRTHSSKVSTALPPWHRPRSRESTTCRPDCSAPASSPIAATGYSRLRAA